MLNCVCAGAGDLAGGDRPPGRAGDGGERGNAEAVRQRNEEQRERQRLYRERLKAERRPGRDDVARVLLHFVIAGNAGRPDRKGRLEALQDVIVGRLVGQGFDERASHAVFGGLVERYTKEGWGFRRKVYLDPDDGAKAAAAAWFDDGDERE